MEFFDTKYIIDEKQCYIVERTSLSTISENVSKNNELPPLTLSQSLLNDYFNMQLMII